MSRFGKPLRVIIKGRNALKRELVERELTSVLTGRSMAEIAADKNVVSITITKAIRRHK